MANIGVIFLGTIVLGLAVIVLSKYSLKYSLKQIVGVAKLRHFSLSLIAIAFIIHTSGDYFGGIYNSENLEHNLESFAHVLLFVSFTIYAISAKKILETAKEFWFK